MSSKTIRQYRRLFVGAAAGAFAAVLASTPAAHAEAASGAEIHLAAGPLDAALLSLATQTHAQLLFTPELVAGRRAPAVDGKLTLEQALARLLAHTDIEARRAGPGIVVLRDRRATTRPAAARGGSPQDPDPPRPFGAEATGGGPVATARAAAPLDEAPTEVRAVEVTGSHIRGAPPAAPLLVLDRAALERTGRATIAEALEALPQVYGGIATEGTLTTGADPLARNNTYGSSVNLRGLGPDATLVLVDGHRLGGSGAFGDFADISRIPAAAVERVEVLLDGASALYGSDAVGGVVNVILRKDFEGAETRAYLGAATAGTPLQRQFSQVLGKRWGSGHLLLTYEFDERTALSGDDRAYAADADLRPLGGHDQRFTNAFPGNILRTDPLTGAITVGWAIPPGQTGVGLKPSDLIAGAANSTNSRTGQDLLPHQRTQAVYLNASQALGERLELSADAQYGKRRFALKGSVPVASISVNRANPFYVSPNGSASEVVAYSFVGQLPNSEISGSAESLGGSLTAALRLGGDWRAEGWLGYARERDASQTAGLINSTALSEAVGSVPDRPETAFSTAKDGFFNPFTGVPGGNSPAILAYIAEGYSASWTEDEVRSANLQADGSLLRLPGGAVKLAVGAQVRREAFDRTALTFNSSVTPRTLTPTHARRQVSAAYAELRVPLVGAENARPGIEALELSLAGRLERYDDVGETRNPQLGLLWRPTSDLTLRATYGTSFRAPALRELRDPALNSPTQLPLGAAKIRVLLLSGGNPELKPETAKTWTFGADFAPMRWPGLRLSANWFDVRFDNRIDRPVNNNLSGALTDPTLTSFIRRISPATNPADLALISALLASPDTTTAQGVFPPETYGGIVQLRYVNTASLHVAGLDLDGSYRFDLGADSLTLGANASYLARYDQQLTPTAPTVSRLGQLGYPARFRARATADWSHGPLTLGAAVNHTGAYKDPLGARVDADTTLDLQARVAAPETGPWRGVSATLTVRNVFDQAPPFYDNPFGVGYDAANGDPIGRFVALQLTRRW